MYESLEIAWVVGLWLLLALGAMLVCTGIVKLVRSWFASAEREPKWNATQTGLFDKNKRYRFVLGGSQAADHPNRTEVMDVHVTGRTKLGEELSSFAGSWVYVGEQITGEKVYIPCHQISYFEEMKRTDSHA